MMQMRMISRASLCLAALVIQAAFVACAPDPYNVLPQCQQVEKIVMGEAALETQRPREFTGEYILLEGIPFQDGGMEYRPFVLTDIPITPSLGSAILSRKSRFGEIFGLLTKGAAGEASSGRIVPRVGLGELTVYERNLLDSENKDRAVILKAFNAGKKVPATDEIAIQRVFSFARYQLLPDGVWVEPRPGEWKIKGGREIRSRVLARDPVVMPLPPEEPPSERVSEPAVRIETPRPRTR